MGRNELKKADKTYKTVSRFCYYEFYAPLLDAFRKDSNSFNKIKKLFLSSTEFDVFSTAIKSALTNDLGYVACVKKGEHTEVISFIFNRLGFVGSCKFRDILVKLLQRKKERLFRIHRANLVKKALQLWKIEGCYGIKPHTDAYVNGSMMIANITKKRCNLMFEVEHVIDYKYKKFQELQVLCPTNV
jgi:hypothetical protein